MASETSMTARSPDRALAFTLRRRPFGVLVQRSEQASGGVRLVQSTLFTSAQAFVAWCDSDPLRFAYPMLFYNLARSGGGLFDHV